MNCTYMWIKYRKMKQFTHNDNHKKKNRFRTHTQCIFFAWIFFSLEWFVFGVVLRTISHRLRRFFFLSVLLFRSLFCVFALLIFRVLHSARFNSFFFSWFGSFLSTNKCYCCCYMLPLFRLFVCFNKCGDRHWLSVYIRYKTHKIRVVAVWHSKYLYWVLDALRCCLAIVACLFLFFFLFLLFVSFIL